VIPADGYKMIGQMAERICQHFLEELEETVRLKFLTSVLQSSEDNNLIAYVHLILDNVSIIS